MTAYIPKPLDTSTISIPESLNQLVESLAKNVHENWAAQRMREGWIFGETRDDTQKTHPCLIPYEELPDTEKEYDRITAIESLKSVIHLGYDITERKG